MTKTKTRPASGKAQAQELLARSAPVEHDPAGAAETPSDIAEEFKSAVASQEAEEGIEITAKAKGKSAPAAAPVGPPAPAWTASGIGQLAVHLNNAVAMAYDLPEAEPEEREELSQSFAGFLTAVWPTGATYEPHVRFVAAELAFWTPRMAARIKRAKELDRETVEAHELQAAEAVAMGAPGLAGER